MLKCLKKKEKGKFMKNVYLLEKLMANSDVGKNLIIQTMHKRDIAGCLMVSLV